MMPTNVHIFFCSTRFPCATSKTLHKRASMKLSTSSCGRSSTQASFNIAMVVVATAQIVEDAHSGRDHTRIFRHAFGDDLVAECEHHSRALHGKRARVMVLLGHRGVWALWRTNTSIEPRSGEKRRWSEHGVTLQFSFVPCTMAEKFDTTHAYTFTLVVDTYVGELVKAVDTNAETVDSGSASSSTCRASSKHECSQRKGCRDAGQLWFRSSLGGWCESFVALRQLRRLLRRGRSTVLVPTAGAGSCSTGGKLAVLEITEATAWKPTLTRANFSSTGLRPSSPLPSSSLVYL